MHATIRPLAAALFLVSGVSAAAAQTPDATPDQRAAPRGEAPPKAPDAPLRRVPESGSTMAPGSLSRELNRSGGVLPPPPTGDEGVVSPPNQDSSRTPVIPPPGSPGGNQQIQPK
jgi:hypothetical protein